MDYLVLLTALVYIVMPLVRFVEVVSVVSEFARVLLTMLLLALPVPFDAVDATVDAAVVWTIVAPSLAVVVAAAALCVVLMRIVVVVTLIPSLFMYYLLTDVDG
ncbi:hypothetical protein V5799_004813 [Amblyomma americanum]|uniref:Uncharacterized protein n=1 Tax=Amblyomma americanum TaxID=6943 RepID=A0AAQ4D519_AMBAM